MTDKDPAAFTEPDAARRETLESIHNTVAVGEDQWPAAEPDSYDPDRRPPGADGIEFGGDDVIDGDVLESSHRADAPAVSDDDVEDAR